MSGTIDFFISYTGVDVDWARWIAQQLEAAKYTTVYQARDFNAGGNFVVQMQRAMQQSKRTIAILSPAYLEARFTLPEWAEAFRRDPTGEYALLVPVRVKDCNLDGLLGARVYIDLLGKAEAAASAFLVEQIRRLDAVPLPPAHTPFPGAAPEPLARPLVAAPLGLPLAASLIGRDDTLADLMAKLRAGTTSGVFALEGMGGIGKTALAAEAVARLAEDIAAFPGGAAWITCESLEGEAGLAEVWARVAQALSLEHVTVQPDPNRRRAMLAAALARGQRLLLALDNIEPALDADALLDTLAVRSHTALLLTARQRVAPHRVAVIDLAPLLPDGSRTLFLERLAQAGGTIATPAEEPALAALLAAVGGLPLALELTAAYAGVQRLSLASVAQEVKDDGLNALAFRDPKRALLTRFERSWVALTDHQQRLFAGLSLLAGTSFPREAALAIGNASAAKGKAEPKADLATLVSYALVEALPGGERLRLHPLMREYAAGKLKTLPPAQQARLGDAMVAFWLAYAEAHPGNAGMDALEAEAAGLMGALAWAHEQARRREVLKLDHALWKAWEVRGRRNEEQRIHTWSLQAATALRDIHQERWAVHQLAELDFKLGQYELARERTQRALELALYLKDQAAEREEVHNLAVLDGQAGRLTESRAGYERALALARELGDLAAEREEVHGLAVKDNKTGRLLEARTGYERALALAQQLGDPTAERVEVGSLAGLDEQIGRLTEARAGYERALMLARQLGDLAAEQQELDRLAGLDRRTGRLTESRAGYERALALAKQLGDLSAEQKGIQGLAMLNRRQGRLREARVGYERGLALARELGDPAAEAEALGSLGLLTDQLGEPEQGRKLVFEALAIRERLDDIYWIGVTHMYLAWLDERAGNRARAIAHFRDALRRFEQVQSPEAEDVRASLRRLGADE